MSKIKEVSSFNGTSWDTAVPLGAEDINIDITSNTQNPADSSSTLESLIASDVTVANGDTGAGAWTKYNRFRKKVVNNLDLRKKTVSLTKAEYEALEQAGTVDNDTIYMITDDLDYEDIYTKSQTDALLAAKQNKITLTGALYGNGSTVEAKPSIPTVTLTKAQYDALSAADKAKDILYNITDDEVAGTFQPLITASGVLQGNGGGGITAKAVDATPTTGSSNLVTSGGVKSALTGVGSDAVYLSKNDNLNSVVKCGFYYWGSNSPTNAPTTQCSMIVSGASSRLTQIAYSAYYNATYTRSLISGTWSSWENLPVIVRIDTTLQSVLNSAKAIPYPAGFNVNNTVILRDECEIASGMWSNIYGSAIAMQTYLESSAISVVPREANAVGKAARVYIAKYVGT